MVARSRFSAVVTYSAGSPRVLPEPAREAIPAGKGVLAVDAAAAAGRRRRRHRRRRSLTDFGGVGGGGGGDRGGALNVGDGQAVGALGVSSRLEGRSNTSAGGDGVPSAATARSD